MKVNIAKTVKLIENEINLFENMPNASRMG